MRTLPLIKSIWDAGGPFIGTYKPVTRIFVQEPWLDAPAGEEDFVLRTASSSGVGSSADRGVPVRWFQKQDNSQSMKELPNVVSVSIDRSIDQDAGTIDVRLSNQWMYQNGLAPSTADAAGQPGYFTPTRGDSMEASALWGHAANEWNGVLVPNALLRVYTGLGGESGDVLTAVANGNLALYGMFLVDEVVVGTDGRITLRGRDMAKLLIEQQLFPPLVPIDKYPLQYSRWMYTEDACRTARRTLVFGASSSGIAQSIRSCSYADSSADQWEGGTDVDVNGHHGSDCLDGNVNTYAWSEGYPVPDAEYATVWWEFDVVPTYMNAVHVNPWGGPYEMYISVSNGGSWYGTETVPYGSLGTLSPAVDTGAGIPYVAKFTVSTETAGDFVLGQGYNADKVRISFRKLADSGFSPWRYRAGIRIFRVLGVADVTEGLGPWFGDDEVVTFEPFIMAGASRILSDETWSQGFTTVSNFDQQDVFGDARRHNRIHRSGEQFPVVSVKFTKSGDGYYILGTLGQVRAHGDAVWYGDPENDGVSLGVTDHTWDIAVTHTGEGYWVLTALGQVYAYGDAVDYGMPISAATPKTTPSIAAHPTAMGYWVLRNDGTVHARGAASSYGGFEAGKLKVVDTGSFANGNEQAHCIAATSTGEGYWVLTSTGRVRAFGDAKKHGQPYELADHSDNIFTKSYHKLMPTATDGGYWLLHASGRIECYGDAEYFGGPIPGTNAMLRWDGNYLDYADIAKDLALWSGFCFYDPAHPSNEPAPVYGAIETTGAWARDDLPDDIFDKRPVIDALTQIKEVVGYVTFVDSEGRFRFESPNWFRIGNYDENGQHVATLPEVNESVQLTGYSVSTSDDPVRSSIIISSHDPYADFTDTLTYTYVPPSAAKLRGLVKPAMWINDYFGNPVEQQIMAELIGLHISFQDRIGQVTCVAAPFLELNDQIRIYERQTSEVFVHYIRGINFQHDLDQGTYKTTLTTHWLAAGNDSGNIVGGEVFPASTELQERIDSQQYGKLTKDPGGRL